MSDRPRDHLGRPVPAGSPDVVPGVPMVDALDDETAWLMAIAYLEGDQPFHAHEVFEQRWRTAPAGERDAWRALAQWGAALTHDARGNAIGARRLAQRALATLDDAAVVPPAVDADLVRSSCIALAGR